MTALVLFILEVIAIFAVNALNTPIKPGHYTNSSRHFALDIPEGFVGRNVADKGLYITKDSEISNGQRSVLSVIGNNTNAIQTTEQLTTVEPLAIKQIESKGSKLVSKTTTDDGGHLLIFHDPDKATSRSFTGSYTKPGTTTVVFFSIALPLADKDEQSFLNIVKTIRYEL